VFWHVTGAQAGLERLGDGQQRIVMASSQEQLPEFVEDPLAYAMETRRMAKELQHDIFPPWRWPGWYRRRRVIEERLRNLRVLRRMIDESQRADG
jgi:hypothetical protein